MAETRYIALLEAAVKRFNHGDLEGYLTLYSDDITVHGFPADLPAGKEGARTFYVAFLSAFPDGQIGVEDLVCEGEKVAARYRFRGTNRGTFMGMPASGRAVEVEGMTIFHFAEGVCAERWQSLDMLGLLQQLGAVPVPS